MIPISWFASRRRLRSADSGDSRVGLTLLRIARRDAGNHWMRSAVLCSALATAGRMLVDLCDPVGADRERGRAIGFLAIVDR